MAANTKHLVLLEAIGRKNTTDLDELGKFINDSVIPDHDISFYYDEYGMVLIGMFHSFFIYPFDKIYDISGGYTLDRQDGLDFSQLDLSMIDVLYIDVDDSPLLTAKAKADGLRSRRDELINKINKQQQNLSKVQGKPGVVNKINQSIIDLNNSLSIVSSEYAVADSAYNAVYNDFTNNMMYFRNKAIIEGIRNAIAHGNYEFLLGKNFDDTHIVFNDIYEGKLTFKAQIRFEDFEKLFNVNTDKLVKFIDSKINDNKGKILSKK